MNKRIRELALQAGGSHYPGVNSMQLEKFAELIVKECIGVVEGGSFLHDQAPTAIFAKECSGAIKRHFGVTE
jgi:hypothetical protein